MRKGETDEERVEISRWRTVPVRDRTHDVVFGLIVCRGQGFRVRSLEGVCMGVESVYTPGSVYCVGV